VRNSRRLWVWFAVAMVLALIVAACAPATESTTTTTAGTSETTTTAGTSESTTTTAAGGTTTGFTYKLGIFEDITTDNFWAYMDPESSVWNAYVLGNQHTSLFTLAAPTWQLVPALATDLPSAATQQGDDWVVTVPLRSDYMWSDGTPVTANDVAFTFNTAGPDFHLGGNWAGSLTLYSPDDPATTDVDEYQDGIKSVTAVDDQTVQITFSSDPGLAVWQMGVGLMPIMPQHFWQTAVDQAKASDDPSTTLYAASGAGEPSAGPFIYDSHEPGAYAQNVANPDSYYNGTTYKFYSDGSFEQSNSAQGFDETYFGSGGGDVTLEYTDGPYASDAIYSIYSDQNAAILALKSGDIDFMLNPIGLSTGLKNEVLNSPELSLISNASNGWRYLAFNMRKAPMSFKGFRQAIACLTNKEFLQTLLGGAIIPAYSTVPEGNTAWANPDVPKICYGLSDQDRFNQAIQYLKDDGFTWDVEPQWDEDTAGNLLAGTGTGLKDPNGDPVPTLELLAPGPGYDPLRSTTAVWIAQWAGWMGIPVEANATGFNVIVDKVFATGDAAKDWDMYILGWSLGNPALPDFQESFFASWQDSANGGFNTPGYNNPEFDALAKEFLAATDIPTAQEAVKAMDANLVENLPYEILFTTPILEAYNSVLVFPFTNVLDGLANLNGLPADVQLASS
jgi:peptide/nickel transport system substrate-binding protein